jgi:predicted nucleic acid-binding protein
MKPYADTSFLFSYYSTEGNSTRADMWRQANAVPLPLTVLHRLELRNALELAAFQQRSTPAEAAAAWNTVEIDLAAGLLVESSIPLAELYQDAEKLAVSHTAATGARSLDILHVAAAQKLGADEFVTFDQRQTTLARRIGLGTATL